MPTKLQTLQDHCRRFESGLQATSSADEARLLKERICFELGESCQSWYVRELLEEHATALIHARFVNGAKVEHGGAG